MTDDAILSEAERILRRRFLENPQKRTLPSDATPVQPSARIESLTLPSEMRSRLPVTKAKYLVKENPQLVQWEREVRKFERNLSPDHEHRISAVMIYEWATGIRITELMMLERLSPQENKITWRADLRKINQILRYYFGKPYMTYIAGAKVPKAYRVKKGYYITRHRPMTLSLWLEYQEGVLNP